MSHRLVPLINGEIYHVFNRSVARQPIFLDSKDYRHAIETIKFYVNQNTPLSFSHYRRLLIEERLRLYQAMEMANKKLVSIYAYCLMPNHFHFLLQQNEDDGIKKFISNFQNSHAKYFNTKTGRSGALFQSMFKAVRIETDEQFVHVGRYIHLNPLTSYVVEEAQDLENYQWGSFPEYLGKPGFKIAEKERLLGYFKSPEDIKSFTLNQAEYQRELDKIKHLALE